MRNIIIASLLALLMTSCGEYARVQKSQDYNYKFDYAKRAYEEGKYVQAATLLEDCISVTISLTQVSQVKDFVDLVNQFPFDVDVVSGRYTVNAKSMLGIYSLDLSKPLQVLIYSDDCEELKNALKAFNEK